MECQEKTDMSGKAFFAGPKAELALAKLSDKKCSDTVAKAGATEEASKMKPMVH